MKTRINYFFHAIFQAAAKVLRAIRYVYIKVAPLFTAAFFIIILMGALDRLYGTNFMAEFIAAINNPQIQSLMNNILELNHQAVIDITEWIRTTCPWNNRNPDTVASETYFFVNSPVA